MRSSTAASRSSSRRVAAATANGASATSARASPRQRSSARRSRLAAASASVASSALPPVAGQLLERRHIDVAGGQGQPIAGRHRDDDVTIGQYAAQPGHQRLQGVGLVGRGLVAPEGVGEPLRVDGATDIDRQPDEQGAQSGTTDVDRAVVPLDGQRPQDPHAHGATLPVSPRSAPKEVLTRL